MTRPSFGRLTKTGNLTNTHWLHDRPLMCCVLISNWTNMAACLHIFEVGDKTCSCRICLHFNLSVSFDSFPEVTSCAGSLMQCSMSLNLTLRYQNALHCSLLCTMNGTMDHVDTQADWMSWHWVSREPGCEYCMLMEQRGAGEAQSGCRAKGKKQETRKVKWGEKGVSAKIFE